MGMTDTVTRWLSNIYPERTRAYLTGVLKPLADRYSSQSLITAGLAIKAGGGVLVKIGSADYYAAASGVLVKIAASTDMPALVGVITAASYNVFCFFVDSAAAVTVAMGTEATTIGSVKFPPFPEGKALIGWILVTHSSTFTGNTTPLDTATTVYFNGIGPFDPSMLI